MPDEHLTRRICTEEGAPRNPHGVVVGSLRLRSEMPRLACAVRVMAWCVCALLSAWCVVDRVVQRKSGVPLGHIVLAVAENITNPRKSEIVC